MTLDEIYEDLDLFRQYLNDCRPDEAEALLGNLMMRLHEAIEIMTAND